MRRKLSADVVLGVAALAVVLVVALAKALHPQAAPSVPSSYDTGRYGYAAYRDLLLREGLRVRRFERDHYFLRESNLQTLILAQPSGGVTRNDVLALKAWVSGGGHLIVLAPPYGGRLDALAGIPASKPLAKPAARAYPFSALLPQTRGVQSVTGSFADVFAWNASRKAVPLLAMTQGIAAMTYPLGAGRVTLLTDAGVFSNARLSNAGNAQFAVQILGPHPGAIAFDETVQGYGSGQSLWAALPKASRIGAVLAAFAVLVAILGNVLRFAPPVPPARVSERDSSAYITSMANLLARAGARRKALHDAGASALQSVRRAAGVSERTPLRAFLARVPDGPQRAMVLELDRLLDVETPSNSQLLRAGALAAQLRKDTAS